VSSEAAAIELPENSPLVSCVMPTRNRRDFLPLAIQLFQRQDYPRKELIILDDGEPAHDLIPDDPAIRYVRIPRRTSIGKKRNIGCEMAAGPIIAQWDDDDWYAAHRLRYQVAALLDGRTHMSAIAGDLFLDLPGGQVWQCDEAAARSFYPHGCFPSSLVYWRMVWEKLFRYPDRSMGEVGAFLTVPQKRGAQLSVLPNLGSYVYIRHRTNTWGQFVAMAKQKRASFSMVDAATLFPSGDAAFYKRFAAGSTPHGAGEEAVSSPSEAGRPLVTCILPARGHGELVARAIECFLAQDYPNKELVIVDDGEEPISDVIPQDDRIRHERLGRAVSLGDKRNRGCEVARGKILAHFEARDWHAPSRLSRQVRHLIERGVHMTAFSEESPVPDTLVYWRVVWEQLTLHPRGTNDAESLFVKVARHLAASHSTLPLDGQVVRDPSGADGGDEIAKLARGRLEDGRLLPLITCIMPTYGRERFLPQAISYFRRQDYPNKELLILDDSATEPDIEVPDSGDIVFVHLRRRMILGEKRNLCCELARGAIIAHWDDDDWFAPTRLSLQVTPLLHQGAHMSVLHIRNILMIDLREIRAAQHPKFVDSHFMFWKALWREKARYGRKTCGESMVFYAAAKKCAKIVNVMDGEQAVYIRHDSNTWQHNDWKRSWRRIFNLRKRVEDVIPSEDLPFYLRLMGVQQPDTGAAGHPAAPMAVPTPSTPRRDVELMGQSFDGAALQLG